MDKLMRQIQLKMELLGNNEIRYGFSNNGTNMIELIDSVIVGLQKYRQNIVEFPEQYKEKEPNPKYKIEVELLKINE